jgi:hypothetical protein
MVVRKKSRGVGRESVGAVAKVRGKKKTRKEWRGAEGGGEGSLGMVAKGRAAK